MNQLDREGLVDDIKSKIQYLKNQKNSNKEVNALNQNLDIDISKDALQKFKKGNAKYITI